MLVPLAPIIRRATFQVVGFQVAKFVWLPQPIWNIFVKMGIFPEMVRGENEHVWNPPSFNCILSTWKSLSFSMPMMKRQVYLPIDTDIGHGPLQVTEIWAAWGPLLKRKQIPGFSFIRFPCFPRHFFWLFPGDLSAFAITASQKMNAKAEMEYLK